jgi:hypothetical protein
MLLAIVMAVESVQNCPKLPTTAKFCQNLPKDNQLEEL